MRIYELNTRAHCENFDRIASAELSTLSSLGFDAVWTMGVWRISDGAKKLSRIVSEDFEGSPYAVPAYDVNPELGGRNRFSRLVERAHDAGLSVLVDFIPNHMALDSTWIAQHPEYFIRGDTSARNQARSDFFLHRSGEVIAFGRDPYFPPWNDTAQLNYANKALRTRMTDVLKRVSRLADGVRCDMAMLVLKAVVRRQWYPLISDSAFNELMPDEFWESAIRQIKAERPDFKFIAEAYWDTEAQLSALGFDLCYEKRMYDTLVARDLPRVIERLTRSPDALDHSLYFIENHDEPRAASVFGKPENLAAMALILTLPGSVLIHEGQMEGKRERLPVERVKPLVDEQPDEDLRNCYARLLTLTDDDVFKSGKFQLFDPGVYGALGVIRKNDRRVAAYIGQISDAWHRFNSTQMNLSALASCAGASGSVRLTNLFNSQSTTIQEANGGFLLELNRLGVGDDSKFCLLEASTA